MPPPPKVLVVDDTPQNIKVLEAVLIPRGYTVVAARSGAEALARIGRDQPDLVLLDVVMPRRNGREVFEEIHRRAPRPVLFTSGYSADALPAEFLAEHGLFVLPKPYSPDRLLEQVRMALDEALGLVTPPVD